MKKIINSLFFVLSILLFNTCESPQEPDIEPPVIDSITITNGFITNEIDSVDTINEIITITVIHRLQRLLVGISPHKFQK